MEDFVRIVDVVVAVLGRFVVVQDTIGGSALRIRWRAFGLE